jgi:alkylhydroperoxidase family enzyme
MPAGQQAMQRVPMLSREDALARGREQGVDDYIAQMNMFRVLLHFPELAGELNKTIITLVKSDQLLSHRLRELIIMRVSWLAASEYEWWQHWQASLWLGLQEHELAAVQNWEAAECFNEADKVVLLATDETLSKGVISPQTWNRLVQLFPDIKAQIAIVTSIGNWQMFAQILRSLAVPLEEGAPVWPPSGKAPQGITPQGMAKPA